MTTAPRWRRNLAVRVRLVDGVLVLKLADEVVSLTGAARDVWYRAAAPAGDESAQAELARLTAAGFLVPET